MTQRPGTKRRHVCPHCGEGFSTVELTAAEISALRRSPAPVTKVVEKIKVVEKVRTRKLTRRARLFLLRGVDVPKGKEADWKTLKASGMSNAEAAAALGLPFFDAGEVVE